MLFVERESLKHNIYHLTYDPAQFLWGIFLVVLTQGVVLWNEFQDISHWPLIDLQMQFTVRCIPSTDGFMIRKESHFRIWPVSSSKTSSTYTGFTSLTTYRKKLSYHVCEETHSPLTKFI